MYSAIEKLQQVAAPSPRNWSARQPVGVSAELRRILGLPRRVATPVPDEFFNQYRRQLCTNSSCQFYGFLRPLQNIALSEVCLCGGLLGPIGVGEGKTLISLLAPTMLQAKCAVILVPPGLRDRLLTRDIPHLSKHWRINDLATGALHVVAYSVLSDLRYADILDRLQPDCIVADEAHRLAHFTAACTKRFRDYLESHPWCRFVALSGTFTSAGLRDYSYTSMAALGDGSPLPRDYWTLESWAEAIDPGEAPAPPGELLRLCEPGEAVRDGYRRRLVETPGVVASGPESIPNALNIYRREIRIPKAVRAALDTLSSTWVTAGGVELTDALSYWSHARDLSTGMYLERVWPNAEPMEDREEWLDATREWHREVRQKLKHPSPGMDSEALLEMAAREGRWEAETFARWDVSRHLAKPATEARWVSDFMVRSAVSWGRKQPGIIWVEHPALGESIAMAGDFPWYGEGALAAATIEDEPGTRTIVVSIAAHSEGKNLQAFHNNLITAMPSSATITQQMLGRTHRFGQLADEVNVWVYLHTPEVQSALRKARLTAQYIQGTLNDQKLLNATYDFDPDCLDCAA